MSLFKSIWIREKCPRCGGNLMLEREEYGQIVMKCLMCARVIDPDKVAPVPPAELFERAESV